MGVLESIINLKQNEEAKRNAMWSNIVNAPMNYINAKNQAMNQGLTQQNLLSEIKNRNAEQSFKNMMQGLTIGKNLIDVSEATQREDLLNQGQDVVNMALGIPPKPKVRDMLEPAVAKVTPPAPMDYSTTPQQPADKESALIQLWGNAMLGVKRHLPQRMQN
jgi:hypothetical protein